MAESRKQVRLILLGCLLLAILSGLSGWVLRGSRSHIAEVTIVSAKDTPDGMNLEVTVNARNNTAWRTFTHDADGVFASGAASNTGSEFLFDRLFRPFPAKGA